MKNIKFTATNFLAILLLSVSAIYAGNLTVENDKALELVAKNLSVKLKTDLVSNNLSVKFVTIERNKVSNNEIVLSGDAFAVLPNEKTELPIKFEATVNPVKETVNTVEYTFIEDAAPVNTEEILMNNLLKKIAADYKTENVVISIDGFATDELKASDKQYKGAAEVRVGELEWKKIDFDIVLNAENNAEKIEYKVKN